MSERMTPSDSGLPTAKGERGQSLVEFALVLPMLLVLLLGIADFGRVFAATIILESSARDAAEAAAQEYLQVRRQADPASASQLDLVHQAALDVICAEGERLPDDEPCDVPWAAICINDSDAELVNYSGCWPEASAADPNCTELASPPARDDPTDEGFLPYVEVRVCYQFRTLIVGDGIRLPLGNGISVGEVWLQRNRSFAVADY